MGYLLVTAVLVVSFGRLGDMSAGSPCSTSGFVVFAVFSVFCR